MERLSFLEGEYYRLKNLIQDDIANGGLDTTRVGHWHDVLSELLSILDALLERITNDSELVQIRIDNITYKWRNNNPVKRRGSK